MDSDKYTFLPFYGGCTYFISARDRYLEKGMKSECYAFVLCFLLAMWMMQEVFVYYLHVKLLMSASRDVIYR